MSPFLQTKFYTEKKTTYRILCEETDFIKAVVVYQDIYYGSIICCKTNRIHGFIQQKPAIRSALSMTNHRHRPSQTFRKARHSKHKRDSACHIVCININTHICIYKKRGFKQ